MNDQEWLLFRQRFLSENNVYLSDTPEIRRQFEAMSTEVSLESYLDTPEEPENTESAMEISEKKQLTPEQKMIEAMRRKKL